MLSDDGDLEWFPGMLGKLAYTKLRKAAFLEMIEAAMGKTALRDGTGQAEDYDGDHVEDVRVA